MPELPEVEITKRQLQELIGKEISEFWSDWKKSLKISSLRKIKKDIKGREIIAITRHGKVLFFELSEEKILAFHQRMSGSFHMQRVGERNSFHVHTRILFSDGTELEFRDPRKFGVVWYGTLEEIRKDPYIRTLGPDALSVSFSEFEGRLRKHRGMIKPILLRQDIVAGIGNIIVDETLWGAKIHPCVSVETLSSNVMKKLFHSLKNILQKSIALKGSSIISWAMLDGNRGEFQNHFSVYGKDGKECLRCRYEIDRLEIEGRGTWVCSRCQEISKETLSN